MLERLTTEKTAEVGRLEGELETVSGKMKDLKARSGHHPNARGERANGRQRSGRTEREGGAGWIDGCTEEGIAGGREKG